MPAHHVTLLSTADLINDPENARKHPRKNIDAIKESLRRFGQQKPIIIDETNTVIAGNGLLQAARELGMSHVFCIRTELASADAKAFAIADNRTAELAEWDMEALAASLKEFRLTDEDLLRATGWEEDFHKVVKPPVGPGQIYEHPAGMTKSFEQYEAASIRQLVVLYERSKYEEIVAKLDTEMEARDLQSHAEVIAALLGVEP